MNVGPSNKINLKSHFNGSWPYYKIEHTTDMICIAELTSIKVWLEIILVEGMTFSLNDSDYQ